MNMTAEDATREMVDLVNSDRPFTPEERANIMESIDMITGLLNASQASMTSVLWSATAVGFLLGWVIGKLW